MNLHSYFPEPFVSTLTHLVSFKKQYGAKETSHQVKQQEFNPATQTYSCNRQVQWCQSANPAVSLGDGNQRQENKLEAH